MTALPRRTLGRTGLDVTTLGYGAMELRERPTGHNATPPISDADASKILNAVLDAGINFVDTSIDYGTSETLIGRHIAHRRKEYFLASKCGCTIDWAPPPGHQGAGPHDYSRANILRGIEHSLRCLKTDYLDLLQVHISPSVAELEREDVPGTLDLLRRQGKVRWIGMSGILPHVVDHVAMGLFDTFQIPWSMFQPEHEAAIAAASGAGAGIIIRGGAARGTPANWAARDYYRTKGTELGDLWAQARMDELLDGQSRMDFTLRYTLSNPDLDTTIVGTRNPAHLASNVAAAAKGPLSADVLAETRRRLAAVSAAPQA